MGKGAIVANGSRILERLKRVADRRVGFVKAIMLV
jgi:hypothetical protein